jgi:hypothetical protein
VDPFGPNPVFAGGERESAAAVLDDCGNATDPDGDGGRVARHGLAYWLVDSVSMRRKSKGRDRLCRCLNDVPP